MVARTYRQIVDELVRATADRYSAKTDYQRGVAFRMQTRVRAELDAYVERLRGGTQT